MSTITDMFGREILDSRGNPTVEVDVLLASGVFARAEVPSGASKGAREAVELRDDDPDRYGGLGVLKAVRNINEVIGPEVEGIDADEQGELDRMLRSLDGTPNKGNLGANAMLGVSLAVARAAALDHGLPLYQYLGGVDACVMPVPMMNIINGGDHALNNLDMQGFMVVPTGARSFTEALRMGVRTYQALREVLASKGHSTGVGDEGGYAPDLASAEIALGYIVDAIRMAGYEPGDDIALALDAAADGFYADGLYVLAGEGRSFTPGEIVDFYAELADRFPIVSIEDGMSEVDIEGWRLMTEKLGEKIQVVGDDVFATNREFLERGIAGGIANAVTIKCNQVGTLSETLETIRAARIAGYAQVVAHRSGETEDTFIADMAVAAGAGQLKAGAPCRGERVAKYNQLLRIEENLGDDAVYPGISALAGGRPKRIPERPSALNVEEE